MNRLEKTSNLLLGASFLSWAFLGMSLAIRQSEITSVRISITLINFIIGIIFLIRAPIKKQGNIKTILISTPSLIACGVAFKLSQPTSTWPPYAEIIFVIGTAFAILSFLYLGKSFSIFPAIRGIVIKGPYRIIRHPAYFGELLMTSACLMAAPKIIAIPFAIALASITFRILSEEKLLQQEFLYKQYCKKVTWKLLPGIW